MEIIKAAYVELYRLSHAVTSLHPLHNAIMVAHNSVVDLDDYEFLQDIADDLDAIIDAWTRDIAEIAMRYSYTNDAWITDPITAVLHKLQRDIAYVQAYGE